MRDKTKDTLHRNREILRKLGLLAEPPTEDDGSMYDPLVEEVDGDTHLSKVEDKLHEVAVMQIGCQLAMEYADDEEELKLLAGLVDLSTVVVETCIEEYRRAYASIDKDSHLYIDDLIQEILQEAEEDAIEEHKKFKPKKPPLSNE